MDGKALQLAARFALPPNSLGYCGRGTAPEKFKDCILKGKCGGIEKELEKFIVLHPYFETLAEVTGEGKFSYPAVEAYCLGNDELKKAKLTHYRLLLKYFANQGVPPWLISELKKQIPKKFIPFHLFQVLHVGVGRASGAVPFNMDSVNNCMVRWGKVLRITNGELRIKLNSLEKNKNKYKLVKTEGNYSYRKDFLPGLKTGDTVAVHWKQAVKKLTKKEETNLKFWTGEVLKAVN